jgi:hypothetical protein
MALATLTETLHRNRAFIPHDPTLKQSLFLSLSCREAMYGGAAGGGKSDALLMAAAQYVDVPGYAALLLRRSYRDLALPGALMDRAHAWWRGKAHWSSADKTYTFPSGATITFGYLANDADVYGYQGAEFQFVGFDELTQFTPWQYRYLFSRTRRLAETPVPVRMRAASNPGGSGHAWVYERFLATGRAAGRIFVPAKLADNPHLDAETYRESLAELDPITQQQLLGGVWITDESAHPYNRAWWRGTNRFDAGDERLLRSVVARYISWDTAFKDKDSSAYTACVVGDLLPDYRLLTRYAWRDKLQFPDLPAAIERIAREWNTDGKLRGSSGSSWRSRHRAARKSGRNRRRCGASSGWCCCPPPRMPCRGCGTSKLKCSSFPTRCSKIRPMRGRRRSSSSNISWRKATAPAPSPPLLKPRRREHAIVYLPAFPRQCRDDRILSARLAERRQARTPALLDNGCVLPG